MGMFYRASRRVLLALVGLHDVAVELVAAAIELSDAERTVSR